MDKLLRVAAEVPEAFVYLVSHSRAYVNIYSKRHTTDRTIWHILSSGCLTSSGQKWEVHEYVNSPLGYLDASIYEAPFEKDELMLPRTIKLPHHYRDFSGGHDA